MSGFVYRPRISDALVVFDLSALVYAARRGGDVEVNQLLWSNVGAILGKERPAYAAIAADPLDGTSRLARRRIDPGYKANRDGRRAVMQLPHEGAGVDVVRFQDVRAHAYTQAASLPTVPLLHHPEHEADDWIASAVREHDGEALIVARDKDLYPLFAGGRVRMVDPSGRREVDPDTCVARYGVPVDRIADFLALAGDPTDGIPGVPGIGEVRARALIRADYGPEQLAFKFGEPYVRSAALVRLRDDLPVPLRPLDLGAALSALDSLAGRG